MVKLLLNENIELCQGDYGNLGFTVSDYKMTSGDNAVLVVKDCVLKDL